MSEEIEMVEERLKDAYENIKIPRNLPFLESLCWQTRDFRKLTLSEMLSRYERGWRYRGVLADLEGDELDFVRKLVEEGDSWIANDVWT